MQMNEFTFPTFFSIAMDYLPIQALAVPSEQVFSSISETDTVRHNCISSFLMEVIQMLKYGLKKAQLDFTDGWSTDKALMGDPEEADDDLLAALLQDDKGQALDLLIEVLEDKDDKEDDIIEL